MPSTTGAASITANIGVIIVSSFLLNAQEFLEYVIVCPCYIDFAPICKGQQIFLWYGRTYAFYMVYCHYRRIAHPYEFPGVKYLLQPPQTFCQFVLRTSAVCYDIMGETFYMCYLSDIKPENIIALSADKVFYADIVFAENKVGCIIYLDTRRRKLFVYLGVSFLSYKQPDFPSAPPPFFTW